ncbi:MAG TPA: DUF5908 family protein [Puia sp.]
MPIEIRELVIKAVVGGKEKGNGKATLGAEELARIKKEITKEVMGKLDQFLQQKNER